MLSHLNVKVVLGRFVIDAKKLFLVLIKAENPEIRLALSFCLILAFN